MINDNNNDDNLNDSINNDIFVNNVNFVNSNDALEGLEKVKFFFEQFDSYNEKDIFQFIELKNRIIEIKDSNLVQSTLDNYLN